MNHIMVPIEQEYEPIEVEQGQVLDKFIKQNLEGVILNHPSIVSSAMNTISQFTLKKNDEIKFVKTGLAFGKVQSGKTTYFLCTAACALDNGFDIIIILSGVTNNLLQQNWERLRHYFRNCKTFLEFGNSARFDKSVEEDIYDLQDFFKSYEESGKKSGVIFSVLKNDKHLMKIQTIVSSFNDKRILVIDDEGDQFSLNTKINAVNKESKIFQLIKDIVYSNENTSLLTVTATPQANLFAYVYNELSPDFVEIVEPGIGYCGLETFHSNNYYIQKITGDEINNTDELRQAIIYYLFTIYECEINKKEIYSEEKNWMLIHNSRLTSIHLSDFKELNDIINYELQPICNIKNFTELDKTEEKNINVIKKLYQKFDIKNKFSYTFDDFIHSFQYILNCVFKSNTEHNILIVNSKEFEKKVELQKTKYGILIGGDMLGRGITIKGLTVSYLTRDTKSGKGNIDTILQRARWFGYRQNTLELTKIFTTLEIQNKFEDIYMHDISLYDELKYCIENNIPLKESKLPIWIRKNLVPTRPNVIKKGYMSRTNSNNFTQQRNINCELDYDLYNDTNIAINNLLKDYEYNNPIKEIKKYEIESEKFQKAIQNYLDCSDIYNVNERVYESMKDLFQKESKISLLIMKDYEEESKGYTLKLNTTKKRYKKLYMGNVLPGSNSSDYLGDAYHFNNFNHIQIHFTRIKDSEGNWLYNGKKILFFCVNNKNLDKEEYIKRVIE